MGNVDKRLFSIIASMVLVGCLDASGVKQGDAPARVGTLPEGIPTADAFPSPSLQAPPTWWRGEWWTFEVTASAFGNRVDQVTAVVADANERDYLVGVPEQDGINDFVLLSHLPWVGEIGRTNLSWSIHDHWTEFVKFPLREGSTWQTTLAGAPATAMAIILDATHAQVDITGGVLPIRVVYNATLGAFDTIDLVGLVKMKVIDHGYGYTGSVLVPLNVALPIFHGRAAVAVEVAPKPTYPMLPQPVNGPADNVNTPQRQHGSVIQFVGNFFLLPAHTHGAYAEHLTLPSGQVKEIARTPLQGVGLSFHTFRLDKPGGTWQMKHVAAGAGIAATEAIFFDTATFKLKEGAAKA